MITIGVIENEKDAVIIKMLRKIFNHVKMRFSVIESYDTLPGHFSSTVSNVKIKEYIHELEKNNADLVIVKISIQMLEKEAFEGIEFDILVYDTLNRKDLSELNRYKSLYREKIFKTVAKNCIAIVNGDREEVLDLIKDIQMCVIAYGLSSKATITASSISEDTDDATFIYCIQRNIKSKHDICVEPQEFPVRVTSAEEKDIYNALAAVTTAIVCDVDIEIFQMLVL